MVAILIFGLGAGISFYEGIAWTIEFASSTVFADNARSSTKSAPTLFTIRFEDTAAMLGLHVALLALLTTQFLNVAWTDAAASIVIAVILATTAVGLAFETKSLLTDDSPRASTVDAIRDMAR